MTTTDIPQITIHPRGGEGGVPDPPVRDAASIAAMHTSLRASLGSVNRRLDEDGAQVVAYSTWFEAELGRDVIVLLWRTPSGTGPRDHDAIRRYMEVTDEELGFIDTSVIAHQLLGPERATERPKGVDWIEMEGSPDREAVQTGTSLVVTSGDV
jgi:hypothetical protein